MTHKFYIHNEDKTLNKKEMLKRFPYLKNTETWVFIQECLNDDYKITYYPKTDKFDIVKWENKK